MNLTLFLWGAVEWVDAHLIGQPQCCPHYWKSSSPNFWSWAYHLLGISHFPDDNVREFGTVWLKMVLLADSRQVTLEWSLLLKFWPLSMSCNNLIFSEMTWNAEWTLTCKYNMSRRVSACLFETVDWQGYNPILALVSTAMSFLLTLPLLFNCK